MQVPPPPPSHLEPPPVVRPMASDMRGPAYPLPTDGVLRVRRPEDFAANPVDTVQRAEAPAAGWQRPAYSVRDVFEDPARAQAFTQDYLQHEARWFELARDPQTLMTHDGVGIDAQTGAPLAARMHSAPSKESLDIGLLVKALEGDPKAVVLVGKGDPAKAKAEALRILGGKMDTLERWHREYPGYGGYLPWFINEGNHIRPADDWVGHCPGLDNGEWAWSMIVAERELRAAGATDLADRYGRYNDLLRASATRMWYDADAGKVRGDVRISDIHSADTRYETMRDPLGHGLFITGEHGVHEGQMLLLYTALLGKDIPKDAAQRIFSDVHMKRIEHPDGTTWQGFWGSSHESWAYLFLPYRDIPQFRDLFRIREEVRTQNAAERGYPGLAASINAPDLGPYISDAGIEDIGTQKVTHNNVFAPYAAFPLLLQFADARDHNYGLAWLTNMLAAPHMYGPIGGLESSYNDGRQSAMVKTVDGSLPNLLAMMGGLERESAVAMKELGVYDGFKTIMIDQYRDGFGSTPLREPRGFALPPHAVGGALGTLPAPQAAALRILLTPNVSTQAPLAPIPSGLSSRPLRVTADSSNAAPPRP